MRSKFHPGAGAAIGLQQHEHLSMTAFCKCHGMVYNTCAVLGKRRTGQDSNSLLVTQHNASLRRVEIVTWEGCQGALRGQRQLLPYVFPNKDGSDQIKRFD